MTPAHPRAQVLLDLDEAAELLRVVAQGGPRTVGQLDVVRQLARLVGQARIEKESPDATP